MKTQNLRRTKLTSITNSRWAAYATAGAASALACANTAEATIHHVDVNQSYTPAAGSSTISVFPVTGSVQFTIRAFLHSSAVNGHASFGMFGGGAKFRGYTSSGVAEYVSRLTMGAAITPGAFVSNAQIGNYFAYLARHAYGQFTTAGIGFVGFQFNLGGGAQFGWIRFNMNGGPGNSFSLVDYAWGDVGDSIVAGQVPEPGSLGLLALGGAGLIAWRRQRAKSNAQS